MGESVITREKTVEYADVKLNVGFYSETLKQSVIVEVCDSHSLSFIFGDLICVVSFVSSDSNDFVCLFGYKKSDTSVV